MRINYETNYVLEKGTEYIDVPDKYLFKSTNPFKIKDYLTGYLNGVNK